MEQKNILIIEDDPRVRKSIGEMFSENCKVEYAENGTEGLFKMTYNKYDLIITDLHMPIMDGITMLQELKMDPNYTRNIPVLMLTTEANKELKQKGQQAGVSRWLLKPVTTQVLFRILDSIEAKL